jgi:MFS family permease
MLSSGRLVALRSHDFRLLFFGQLVSLTGSQMQQVAVAWQLYLLTHSALMLGMLGLCRVVPVVLFALGGGVVADALDRRRLMLGSQSMMACASITLAVATATGHISSTVIYAVVGFSGIALALDGPARQALVPLLLPREHLANALSLHAMAWEIAAVGGPALAGLVIAWRGVVPIYIADAVSFLAVIAALLAMRHRTPAPASAITLAAAWEGLRFIARSPLIMMTMTLDFVATFFAGALLLMPIYADQILATGPRGLGLLYASQPIGAALAAGILSLRPTIHRQGLAVLWSVAP